MSLLSRNPTTEEVLEIIPEHTDAELEARLTAAADAFTAWRQTSFTERGKIMQRIGVLLRERKQQYAELMTREMGKPVIAALAEIEKCAWTCEYLADHVETILAREVVTSDATESYVQFDPLGGILAVMPWNFPFWQVIRFAVPAIMAGNVGLLKHASNVPGCARALEQVCTDAGLPHGVFQTLLIGSSRVGQVIEDRRVHAVTLTGSEGAGSQVAAIAGRAIKKTVMELGGSDPFIVLSDADLATACTVAVNARLQNNGQSCIAAKRFIVMRDRYEQFIERFRSTMATMVVGDPLDPKTNVGPLATEQILQDLDRQVRESVAIGARVVLGGARRTGKGFFYEPTILADVRRGMPVYDAETFGPVAAVIPVDSVDDAVRVANDSPYGLGASLWTQDSVLAKEVANRIDAGGIFVNGMVKSDARLPFGGIKKSGYGRELGTYGVKEFVNIKTIWMK